MNKFISGASLLVTVVSNYVCISVGLYWAFTIAHYRSSPFVFERFLGIISPVLTVCTLFHSVESFRLSVGVIKLFCDLFPKIHFKTFKFFREK